MSASVVKSLRLLVEASAVVILSLLFFNIMPNGKPTSLPWPIIRIFLLFNSIFSFSIISNIAFGVAGIRTCLFSFKDISEASESPSTSLLAGIKFNTS